MFLLLGFNHLVFAEFCLVQANIYASMQSAGYSLPLEEMDSVSVVSDGLSNVSVGTEQTFSSLSIRSPKPSFESPKPSVFLSVKMKLLFFFVQRYAQNPGFIVKRKDSPVPNIPLLNFGCSERNAPKICDRGDYLLKWHTLFFAVFIIMIA